MAENGANQGQPLKSLADCGSADFGLDCIIRPAAAPVDEMPMTAMRDGTLDGCMATKVWTC